MYLLLAIPIYLLINAYIAHRFIKWFHGCAEFFKTKKFLVIFLIIYTLLALSMLIGFLLPMGEARHIFKRIGNYWLGTFIFILISVSIADGTARILRHTKVEQKPFFYRKRTKYIIGLIIICFVVGLSALGIFTAHNIRQTDYAVTVKKQCSLDTLNIVLIADTHIGYTIDEKDISNMVAKINECNPDLVCFAGDVFDNDYDAIDNPEQIQKDFASIKSKYGVYACYGNHDVTEQILGGFSVGSSDELESDPRMDKLLADSGITLLRDESVLIDNAFYIVGRRDYAKPGIPYSARASIDTLTKDLDKNYPVIVIDHEPKELQETSSAGVSLDLSGHTHDGQIFPGNILTSLTWDNSYGCKQYGDMYSIVTSGVGVWGPGMRLGTKSEITHIKVTFQP